MKRRSELRRTGPPPRNTRLRWRTAKKAAAERRRKEALHARYGSDPMCHWPGCGDRASDSHHLLPRGRGGEDGPDAERPLCRHHHDLAHREPALAEQVGMLLPTRPDGGDAA